MDRLMVTMLDIHTIFLEHHIVNLMQMEIDLSLCGTKMDTLQNPLLDYHLFIEIISFLPLKKRIQLEQLSKFHLDTIRNQFWLDLVCIRSPNTLFHLLYSHNFRNYEIMCELPNYDTLTYDSLALTHNTTIYDTALSYDVVKKLKKCNISFIYETITVSLFNFLLQLANAVEIFNSGDDLTYVQYCSGNMSIMMHVDKPFEYCNSPETFKLLKEKSSDIEKIWRNLPVSPVINQYVCELSKTIYFKYFGTKKLLFPSLIKAIQLFDTVTVSRMENDQQFIHKLILKQKYCCSMAIKKNKLCAQVVLSPHDNLFSIPRDNYIIYFIEYDTDYLVRECSKYMLDPNEKILNLKFHVENNFEYFFISWLNTPLRQNNYLKHFIILNMLHALRCYYPSYIMGFIKKTIQVCIHNDVNIDTLLSLIILLCVDNKLTSVACDLSNDLCQNEYECQQISDGIRSSMYELVFGRIMINSDHESLVNVINFWKETAYSKLIVPLVIIIDNPLKFNTKKHIPLIITVMESINNNFFPVWKAILRNCEMKFHKVTKMLITINSHEILALWIQFMSQYYGPDLKKNYRKIYNSRTCTAHNITYQFHISKSNKLPFRLSLSVGFLLDMLTIESEKYHNLTRIIPITRETISINLLLAVLNLLDQKIALIAFDRWHNLSGYNLYPNSDYHLVLEKICSTGMIKLLDWWKIKGLPFYYTKKSFDLASNYGHTKIVMWWIKNCTSKKLIIRNATQIQYGGYYINGGWKSPESMILLYSHCGLFIPIKEIYDIWWYYGLSITHKKSVLKKIRDNSKGNNGSDLENKLNLFTRYFGED